MSAPPDGGRRRPAPGALAAGLSALVDATVGALVRRPVSVRAVPSVEGVLSGRLDRLEVDLSGVATAGLTVDRLTLSATGVRIRPGLPPRVQADDLRARATVTEASVNGWLRTVRGPARVRLGADGMAVTVSAAGIDLHEVLTRVEVDGRWVVLRPRSASFLGMAAPAAGLFRGYLPLPPLPAGARLLAVDHTEGELSARLSFGPLDEPLEPGLPARLRRRFQLGPTVVT